MLSRKGFTLCNPGFDRCWSLFLVMQKMATIVALVRREAMCPPVRMV